MSNAYWLVAVMADGARAAYGTGVGFAVDAQQLRALVDTLGTQDNLSP